MRGIGIAGQPYDRQGAGCGGGGGGRCGEWRTRLSVRVVLRVRCGRHRGVLHRTLCHVLLSPHLPLRIRRFATTNFDRSSATIQNRHLHESDKTNTGNRDEGGKQVRRRNTMRRSSHDDRQGSSLQLAMRACARAQAVSRVWFVPRSPSKCNRTAASSPPGLRALVLHRRRRDTRNLDW
jgi:hypothetical protein